MEILKLCPFCGGNAELKDVSNGVGRSRFTVICSQCEAQSKEIKTYGRKNAWFKGLADEEAKSKAIAAWNRRADDV